MAGTSSCKQRDVMKGQALRDFLKDPNSVGKVVTLSDGGKATVSRIQPCADSLDGHCWVHFKKHPVRGTDFFKSGDEEFSVSDGGKRQLASTGADLPSRQKKLRSTTLVPAIVKKYLHALLKSPDESHECDKIEVVQPEGSDDDFSTQDYSSVALLCDQLCSSKLYWGVRTLRFSQFPERMQINTLVNRRRHLST